MEECTHGRALRHIRKEGRAGFHGCSTGTGGREGEQPRVKCDSAPS